MALWIKDMLYGLYDSYSIDDYYTDGKYIYLTIADLIVDLLIIDKGN